MFMIYSADVQSTYSIWMKLDDPLEFYKIGHTGNHDWNWINSIFLIPKVVILMCHSQDALDRTIIHYVHNIVNILYNWIIGTKYSIFGTRFFVKKSSSGPFQGVHWNRWFRTTFSYNSLHCISKTLWLARSESRLYNNDSLRSIKD